MYASDGGASGTRVAEHLGADLVAKVRAQRPGFRERHDHLGVRHEARAVHVARDLPQFQVGGVEYRTRRRDIHRQVVFVAQHERLGAARVFEAADPHQRHACGDLGVRQQRGGGVRQCSAGDVVQRARVIAQRDVANTPRCLRRSRRRGVGHRLLGSRDNDVGRRQAHAFENVRHHGHAFARARPSGEVRDAQVRRHDELYLYRRRQKVVNDLYEVVRIAGEVVVDDHACARGGCAPRVEPRGRAELPRVPGRAGGRRRHGCHATTVPHARGDP